MLGEQILCIFSWLSLPLLVSQRVWRADYMHIYVTLAPFACLSQSLESIFYAFLNDSRILWLCFKLLEEQIFSNLRDSRSLCLKAWKADYAYLLDSRSLCLSLKGFEEQTIWLFTWFSAPLLVFPKAWREDFMNIYVTRASFDCLSNCLKSRFCAYLRDSRPLCWQAWRANFMHIYLTLAPFACLSKGLKNRLYAYLRDSRLLWLSFK